MGLSFVDFAFMELENLGLRSVSVGHVSLQLEDLEYLSYLILFYLLLLTEWWFYNIREIICSDCL